MESDLSSSDAALRMLFVEDVELLESGILTSLLSCLGASKCDWSHSAAVALSRPPRLCAEGFSISRQVSSFYGVICLQFLTSNALIPLLSINAQNQRHSTQEQTLYVTLGEASTHTGFRLKHNAFFLLLEFTTILDESNIFCKSLHGFSLTVNNQKGHTHQIRYVSLYVDWLI